MTHTLLQYDEPLAVVRLGPGAEIPEWASARSVFSVTATATETSLVCAFDGVPRKSRHAGPFTAFVVEGTLDLTLTGILAGILQALAESEVPVFTISTFDTDWILVPSDHADRAAEAWRSQGNTVRAASLSRGQS